MVFFLPYVKLLLSSAAVVRLGAFSGRRRKTLIGVGLLTLLMWLAPMIVAATPLRNWALAMIVAPIDGNVRSDGASFGWFSAVEINGLEIHDPDGEQVARIEQLKIDRSLLGLCLNASRLGAITVDGAAIDLRLTESGSNLEAVLAPMLDQPTSDDSSTVMTLAVSDAQVNVTEATSGRQWAIEVGRVDMSMPERSAGPIAISALIQIRSGASAQRSQGEIDLTMKLANGSDSESETVIKLNAKSAPLDLLAAVARRYDPSLQLNGELNVQLDGSIGADQTTHLAGAISASNLDVGHGSLSTDRIQLAQLSAPFDVVVHTDRIHAKRLSVECDVATASLTGEVALDGDASMSVDRISAAPFELVGQADLAKLAAMIPNTIRLRRDTSITSGQARVRLVNRPTTDGQALIGEMTIDRLAANQGDRRIEWPELVKIDLSARRDANGPAIDRLNCQSEFFNLQASGSVEQGSATFTGDLNRLAVRLGQLIDFGGMQLVGRVDGKLAWRKNGPTKVDVTGEANLAGFEWTDAGKSMWRERIMESDVTASLSLDGAKITRLESATATVATDHERIDLRLAKLVDRPLSASAWPVAAVVEGDVSRYPDRLKAWLSNDSLKLAGRYSANAAVVISPEKIAVSRLEMLANDVAVDTGETRIAEPRIELSAAGVVDLKNSVLQLSRAKLISATAELSGESLNVPLTGAGASRGKLQLKADLNQLAQWTGGAKDDTTSVEGQLFAQIIAEHADGRSQLKLNGVVDQFKLSAAADPANPAAEPVAWQEKQLRIGGDLVHDGEKDRVELTNLSLNGDAVAIKASGAVDELATTKQLSLAGDLKYDFDKLAPLLRKLLGAEIKLAGRQQHAFELFGPLGGGQIDAVPLSADQPPTKIAAWRRQLRGKATLGWESAEIYGVKVGASRINATLADGVVQCDPIDAVVNEGRCRLHPTIYLSTSPPIATLPKGPVLTDVKLTPEMCRSGLMYVNPFLAGATSVDGKVSLEIDGARIPLDGSADMATAGRLKIQNVQVTGGPLAGQLLPLAGVAGPARLPLTEQVEFWIQNRQVYHRGVGVRAAKTTLQTEGTVAFDQTVNLTAVMPIPEAWIGRDLAATALRNQTVRIPIGGTLTKPRLDQRRLAELQREFIRQAAGNVILDQGSRLLDRVLGPNQ